MQIAATVIAEPRALILDEPFSGLAPPAADAMADLLRDYTADGMPVLFSSNQLDLVERLCDSRLVILACGRVVASGTADDLRCTGRGRHPLVLGSDAGWVRDASPALGITVADVNGPVALLELPADPPPA